MEITAFKIVIWGGKSSVLWSQTRRRKTKFPTVNIPPQITLLNAVTP